MRKGIWVECESASSPLHSKTSVEELAAYLSLLRVETAYVQVFRRGIAYYPSTIATHASCVATDFDPLETVISCLGARGIEVHAWVNCCNLGLKPDPTAIETLGLGSLVHDNYGRSLSLYSDWSRPPDDQKGLLSLDTPGAWVDPSSPPVQKLLGDVARELTLKYPRLAGVHLDFIRYPYALPIRPGASVHCGLDLGYGPALARFFADSGESLGRLPLKETALVWPSERMALHFDRWRREQVTALLSSVRRITGDTFRLTAAVLAWSDRAYLSAFQDWREWLAQGLIDAALVMAYTADTHHFRLMLQSALPFQSEQSRVYAGLGCYKYESEEELTLQLSVAQALGIEESVLFSYGALLTSKWSAASIRPLLS